MQIISTETNSAEIKLSVEELVIINNSLNEICYGIDMDESEISVRVGAELGEIDNFRQAQIFGKLKYRRT
ncbi:hypothetical protein QUF72_03685 [Desulfobacterales bacterium HSG2]|nr:hypothetical protein [Desulfobacterales bacterium HSG2]